MNEPEHLESVDGSVNEAGAPRAGGVGGVGEAPLAMFVCPYCGSATPDQPRCVSCRGFLDPLSRQASQNAMGPWFIRNPESPFQIGCSYETMVAMVKRGRVTLESILRGPTTSQFWCPAKRVPGLAHLLGVCHSCGAAVDGDEAACPECHIEFGHDPDRQYLGLMPVRSIPGQPAVIAAERPRGEVPEPAAVISHEPAPGMVRHIEALEGNVRWLWGWLIGAMAVLGVVVAVVLAMVLGGFVSFGTNGGAVTGGGGTGGGAAKETNAPAAKPVEKAGGAETGRSVPKTVGGDLAVKPSPAPAAKPVESPVESPAGGPGRGSDGSSSKGPNEAAKPAVRESDGMRRARELLAQDTDESVQQAVTVLEGLVGAGGTDDAGAEALLKAARARAAQRAMRGVR